MPRIVPTNVDVIIADTCFQESEFVILRFQQKISTPDTVDIDQLSDFSTTANEDSWLMTSPDDFALFG